MQEQLKSAVLKLNLVVLRYDGFTRTVEPHALGRGKEGHFLLRCWQVSGGSVSGERTGWKLLRCDEMSGVEVLSEQFATSRPGYKRGDSHMALIVAEI